jgi:hypothetical protein
MVIELNLVMILGKLDHHRLKGGVVISVNPRGIFDVFPKIYGYF